MSYLFKPLRLRVVVSTWLVACLVGFVWPFVQAYYLAPILVEDIVKERPPLSQDVGLNPAYPVTSAHAPFSTLESVVDEDEDGRQDFWIVAVDSGSTNEKVYLTQDRNSDGSIDDASFAVGPAPDDGEDKPTLTAIVLVSPEDDDVERIIQLASRDNIDHRFRYLDVNGDGILDDVRERMNDAVLDMRIFLSGAWLRLVEDIDETYYICETETGALAPTYWDGYAWVLGTPQ